MKESVFVLSRYSWGGCVIYGIYTTKEQAEEALESYKNYSGCTFGIEEFPLNEDY